MGVLWCAWEFSFSWQGVFFGGGSNRWLSWGCLLFFVVGLTAISRLVGLWSFLCVGAWEFSFGCMGVFFWWAWDYSLVGVGAWGCRLFCGWLGSGMGRSVRWRLVARARSTAARQGSRLAGRGRGRVRLARKRLIGVGEVVDLGKLVG